MNPRILSLGDANIDLIARIGRYPIRGGSAYGHSLRKFLGGTAVNFAIGVVRLEETVGCISKIGSDDFGRLLMNGLKGEGVDVSHVFIEEGGHTGTVLAIVDEEGERTFFAFRKGCADTKLCPEEMDESYIRQGRLLQVSGVALVEPLSMKAALTAMRYARKNGVAVSFDPNLRLERWEMPRELVNPFEEALRLSDIVLSGGEEAKCLTNSSTPEEGAKKLLSLGPGIIALKLGSDGSVVVTRDKEIRVPAFSVDVADTTGAGDAYNAGFAVGYIRGWDLKKIATFANAAGAIRVTRRDVGVGLPTRREIHDFLEKHLGRMWGHE